MKTNVHFLAAGILQFAIIDGFGQAGSTATLLDPTFAPAFEDSISAVAVQADGKIIVGGDANHRVFLTRFESNGSLDTSFDPGSGPANASQCQYDSISALATTEQAIFVGGRFASFNDVSCTGIARLSRDGALDENFKVVLGGSRFGCGVRVASIAAQADDKVLLAGDFDSVNGISRDRIARLNPDGSLDTTFSLSITLAPYFDLNCIALQAEGKFILGGRFGVVNGIIRRSIVRLNADGSVDPGFSPDVAYTDGLNGYVRSAVVQRDGNILIGGNFQFVNGLRRDSIARLQADGSLDTSFYPGLASDAYVSAIALEADGKVIAAGYGDWNGIGAGNLFRFNAGLTIRSLEFASTNYLASENTGGVSVTVERIGDTSGTITVDYFTSPGTATAGVDYLEQSGTLSFAPRESAKIIAVPILDNALVDGDKTIVINLKNPSGGALLGPQQTAILKILDDDRPGSVDASFNPASGTTLGGQEIARANWGLGAWNQPFVIQPDGKIWVSGWYNFDVRFGGRLNQDGSLDLSLNSDLGRSSAIGLQSDGRTIVSLRNGTLQRIDEDGSIDPTYAGCQQCTSFYRGVVQPDDKVIGVLRCCIEDSLSTLFRLDARGELDLTFRGPRVEDNDARIRVLTLQQDGKLLLGGFFSAIGEVSRHGITRLLPNGELDSNFNPQLGANTILLERGYDSTSWTTNALIESLVVQPDGKVVVGGRFSIPNDPRRNNLARLNADGSLDTSFVRDEVAANEVSTFAVLQADGRIIVASVFISSDEPHYSSTLTRLNPDGSVDKSFDPGTGPNGAVYQMAWQSDGKLLIAGDFTEINGLKRLRIARLNVATPFKFGPVTRTENSPMRLSLTTEPGKNYRLEASTNLMDWVSLSTNTASSFTLVFEDTAAPPLPNRFYRAHLLR